MDRKRKQEKGGSAVPSTSKSSKLVGSSSASSVPISVDQGGTGGGSRSAGRAAPSYYSAGQGFSGQLHPLLNPVVLSNLFSLCPPELLATCRLVCKTWRDDSLPAWRSSATPRFVLKETANDYDEDFFGVAEKLAKTSSASILGFLQFWERECSTLPYQNFHLANWDFGIRMSAKKTRSQSQTEQLLQLMGSRAKKLTLTCCTFVNVEEFRRVIYQFFPNLRALILLVDHRTFNSPRLELEQPDNNPASLEPVYGEQIHLKSISLRSPNSVLRIPVSWLELVTHFPYLTSVNLSSSRPLSVSSIQSFFEAVSMIRKRDGKKLPKLCLDTNTGLKLSNDQVSQELFGLIGKLNVSLASVKINLSCNLDLIENLLTFHGKTLRTIEFLRNWERVIGPMSSTLEFPFGVKLNNLQELTVCDLICPNMDFLKYTPNLKRLRIVDIVAFGSPHWEPSETELVSGTMELEEMKLSTLNNLYYGYKLSQDDLNRLSNWFPKLEALTAFLDNELFALVCENWPNLKHLHVLGTELNDQGVTGMGGMGPPEIEAGAMRPNVTYLKDLECFQTEFCRSGLTEVSALHGFLKLPKLRRLDISSFSGRQFTGKVERALCKHIPDCQLDSLRCRDLDNEQRDWCPDFEWK